MDIRGVTAIEFAMVIGPFMALAMGIVTIGSQFLTAHFLEYGVEVASRQIRTGEAQKAGLTLKGFRDLVCNAAGFLITCDDRLVVHIKSSKTFAGLSPATRCVTNGELTPQTGNGGDGIRTRAGAANDAVMVSACYEWANGQGLWQKTWNLLSPVPPVQGKSVLSTATAFRSEPFE